MSDIYTYASLDFSYIVTSVRILLTWKGTADVHTKMSTFGCGWRFHNLLASYRVEHFWFYLRQLIATHVAFLLHTHLQSSTVLSLGSDTAERTWWFG